MKKCEWLSYSQQYNDPRKSQGTNDEAYYTPPEKELILFEYRLKHAIFHFHSFFFFYSRLFVQNDKCGNALDD